MRYRGKREKRGFWWRAFCIVCCVWALLMLVLLVSEFIKTPADATAAEEEPIKVLHSAPEIIPAEECEAVDPMMDSKTALAKLVWGEARGCDTTQQAAVVWCVLNRVDSDAFPNDIYSVITQKHQFAGWNAAHPVDPKIYSVVEDVVARWTAEQYCIAPVGRILPAEYLFFTGDGVINTFTTGWQSGSVWNFACENPYK